MWFFLALGCAVSEFVKDLTSKRAFTSLDEYVCAFATACFALPWLGLWILTEPAVSIEPKTFLFAPIAAGLHITAMVLYFRAIHSADLSLVLPLVSFTPFFYLFTSPIMIGEYPSMWGVFGVLLIVLGSYLLNLDAREHGLLEPFKLLLKSDGARSMLGTAVIWSITGNIDRMGIEHCSLASWFFILIAMMAIGLFFLVLRYSKIPAASVWQQRNTLFTLGLFHASSSIFYMQAINLTLVAYVVSVKRLSVVLGVLWGGLMLKEDSMKQRLIATAFMLFGVLCISLGS